MNIICYVSLAIWDINVRWKWACFILSGAGFGLSGLIIAYVFLLLLLLLFFFFLFCHLIIANQYLKPFRWGHEICSEDNEERALVVGSMNELAYVFQAWIPQVAWQQVDAPMYRKGYIAVSVISTVMIFSIFLVYFLEKWENNKRKVNEGYVIHFFFFFLLYLLLSCFCVRDQKKV